MQSFASDNYAAVLPEIMDALATVNQEHAASYGNDPYTQKTIQKFREIFEADVDVYFVFNGTGANVLSISAATQSFHSILCADTSHLYNDESSAPETFTGCRFFPITANSQGKIQPDAIAGKIIRKGDVHFPQIRMLSITQSTEYGTVYSLEELRAIGELCRNQDLYYHIDGSRFFNAAAALDCSLSEMSTKVGVDILSLGGTKIGMMYGEAVVVFHPDLKKQIRFKHKQSMQLASKTRYISAQYEALLNKELWREKAKHANEMAQYLALELSKINGIHLTHQVDANAIFACIPKAWNEPLMEHTPFYVWREDINEVRLMCAWDTGKAQVDAFIAKAQQIAQTHQA